MRQADDHVRIDAHVIGSVDPAVSETFPRNQCRFFGSPYNGSVVLRIPIGRLADLRRRFSVLSSFGAFGAEACSLAVALAVLPALPASADLPRLHLKPVSVGQLDSPTAITHAGDGSGRLFVCDQAGLIHIIRHGMLLPVPFLDLSPTGINRVVPLGTGYSERGLLGLAFHPGYSEENSPGRGRFYVYFSSPSVANPNPSIPQNHVSVISEFRVSAFDPDRADPSSERILMVFGQPQSNHNGGQLEFGPDGCLYIGSGDGGSSNDNNAGHTGGNASQPQGVLGNALDLTNLLGKILRIEPLGWNGPGGAYGIPASNPHVGAGVGVRGEIYAHGLRNPWRFSFDRRPGGTGRLFCGDVGQGRVEEINLIVPGGNYGWRYREGGEVFDPAMAVAGTAPSSWIEPVAQYAHTGISTGDPPLPQLGISITGGYVYRGSAIPGIRGVYLFADYRADSTGGGRIMALEEMAAPGGGFRLIDAVPLTETNPLSGGRRILTMGEDENGELYLGTKTSGGVLQRPGGVPEGAVYRIVPASTISVILDADRDTSILENSTNGAGAGASLHAGRSGSTGNPDRRALVRFNVSSLPAGAVVEAATVELLHLAGEGAPVSMALHRVSADWGEGESGSGSDDDQGSPPGTGDATWFHRFHPGQAWQAGGADFSAQPSATSLIDGAPLPAPVARSWSGAGLVADVVDWRANPGSNFGWVLIGAASTGATAQRFASRESPAVVAGTSPPRLRLSLSAPPSPTPLELFLSGYDGDARPGKYFDLAGDLDGDGLPLLLEHGLGLDPASASHGALSPLGMVTEPLPDGTSRVIVTFLRNPGASDTILTLLAGSDPRTLEPLAVSLLGAPPVAMGGATVIEDRLISGSDPLRLSKISIIVPAPGARHFVRLKAELAP